MYSHLHTALLLDAPQPSIGTPIFMIVGMFVVMYFFMIRPQSKRAKEQKAFAESIAVGEQIVTTAGIHGRINKLNDDGTVQLEIYRGSFMTVDRTAVSMEMTAAYRKKNDSTAVTAAK